MRERPADAGGGSTELIDLVTPDGEVRITFDVEAVRSGSVPTGYLMSALRESVRQAPRPLLFVTDYLGPTLRRALIDARVSFADGTGWVHLAAEDPLVLITGEGASRSPRSGRSAAIVRMNGVAVGRIIRQLAVATPPIGVRALADRAAVSPGSVSKLLATLAAEGIVDRDERGGVAVVRRRELVQRWTRDYAFARTNVDVGYYIAPRGLDRTLARLQAASLPAVLTGSAAARRLLPDGVVSVVPLRLLALYTDQPRAMAAELGLIDADPATANVVLAVPADREILAAADGGPTPAPAAIVLADLLTLPNRSDAEAEQLIDVLARDDEGWGDRP